MTVQDFPLVETRLIVGAVWRSLGFVLPSGRMRDGDRFFQAGRTLNASARAALLRAMARTLIESSYLPVRKDARYDPVELISCALEVCIHRCDRSMARNTALPSWWAACLHAAFVDAAVRTAAFEVLFDLDIKWIDARRGSGEIIREINRLASGDIVDRLLRTFRVERLRARRLLGPLVARHRDALLAEIVVLGSASPYAHGILATSRVEAMDAVETALPFVRAVTLASVGRFVEARVALEQLLANVPGHALALVQVERCCFEIGDVAQAARYAKRASRIGRTVSASSSVRMRTKHRLSFE